MWMRRGMLGRVLRRVFRLKKGGGRRGDGMRQRWERMIRKRGRRRSWWLILMRMMLIERSRRERLPDYSTPLHELSTTRNYKGRERFREVYNNKKQILDGKKDKRQRWLNEMSLAK